MGRTEPTIGLAPQAHRKDVRAKMARAVINQRIPTLLRGNRRAARGVEGARAFGEMGFGSAESGGGEAGKGNENGRGNGKGKGKGMGKGKGKGKGKGREGEREVNGGEVEQGGLVDAKEKGNRQNTTPIKIRILVTDTLTAAHELSHPLSSSPPSHAKLTHRKTSSSSSPDANVCILNMASPLRPGGGVLNGATSQEEFLCARTTLYPSLRESFYRLPEIGGVYTRDVLVFRPSGNLDEPELGAGERWWVDVVTAGMLRFPEVEGEGEGEKRYVSGKDREMVERKMRAVMRVANQQGVRRLVLGAWGCGAYGNPVAEVARLWRKVLLREVGEGAGRMGGRKDESAEKFDGVEQVVFAILDGRMAREFARYFGNGVVVEDEVVEHGVGEGREREHEIEEENKAVLEARIEELEGQIVQVGNPDLKSRLEAVLQRLKTQLAERDGAVGAPSAEVVPGGELGEEEDDHHVEETDQGDGGDEAAESSHEVEEDSEGYEGSDAEDLHKSS
ncbi:hypothetical protein K432DRAFT_294549 [Lepidopterella palustris CBS 459.81]|uniref:Microbial-type PARG catalytic domain-containing protein n=1 Tax=Lepidopterella palustris CBS 459.81 TaxID=1314670 RepID=A0A8E2ED63_9PEZI|nr:hypothetical protein K432DRAFT_294549 [Lepidopterella palustris CBS 459.81]